MVDAGEDEAVDVAMNQQVEERLLEYTTTHSGELYSTYFPVNVSESMRMQKGKPLKANLDLLTHMEKRVSTKTPPPKPS